MGVENAGQQKYADFVMERAKKLQTEMIVWISLLCIALICSFSNIGLAFMIAVIGILIAVKNRKAQKEFKGKLDSIEDKEEFFRQLTAEDAVEFSKEHILITREYILVFQNDIFIYPIEEIKQVEIKNNTKKQLFLVDQKGTSYEILTCSKDKQSQETFRKICDVLYSRIP